MRHMKYRVVKILSWLKMLKCWNRVFEFDQIICIQRPHDGGRMSSGTSLVRLGVLSKLT